MLFAAQTKENNFDIYLALLDELLKGRDINRVNIFKRIFSETRALVLGEKTYYQLDRDTYRIVSFLAGNFGDYFRSVEPNNLSKENLQRLQEYLTSHTELSY